MNKMTKKLIYFCYLIIIIAIILEILVRFWGYSERYMYDPIYMPFSKNSEIPFVLKPGLNQVLAYGKLINTDDKGLRSGNRNKQYERKKIDEYRIAFIGDSVTFGVAVPYNETFPQVAEKCLNNSKSKNKYNVFNYAVPAYSIKEMAATLRYRISEIHPDLVVIGIILDDFDTNRTPGIDKYGIQCYRKTTDMLYDSKIKDFISNNQYLLYIKNKLRKMHISYLIRDIIYKYEKNQKNIDESYKQYLEAMVENNYKYIKDIEKISARMKVPYVILLLPSLDSQEDYDWQKIINRLNQDKVQYIDLLYLSESYERDKFMVTKFDIHPSPIIHKEIGMQICKYIIQHIL